MYFAKLYPEKIKKVVTLDNLRVPFMTDGKFKILSFRSKDPVFKTDPGVVPDEEICEKAGHHGRADRASSTTDMSDRGPDDAKEQYRGHARQVPGGDDSPLKPVDCRICRRSTEAGPVALYAPVKN